MEELVCNECKGRKFRKISETEYECEYCGAITKDTAQVVPKVVVIQPTQPQQIVTPFPSEISYSASLREGFNTLTGKIIIYPDKFVFKPESIFNTGNLSPREWRIVDINGYTKGMFAFLDVKMKDGKKIHLSVYGKKTIITELEARRKYWHEQK